MDVTSKTHYLVLNADGSVVIEDNHIQLQSKSDGSSSFVQLDAEIADEFGISISENEAENKEDEKFVWQHRSTLLFLDEYKKRISKFRNPKIKKKTLWEEISRVMHSYGYLVDGDALDRKMRNMKNTYRTILDNNNKKKSTGRGRIQWEYFDIFEEIFREDKTVNSTPVMSSIEKTSTSSEPCTSPVSSNVENATESEILLHPPVSECSTPKSLKKEKSKQLDIFRKRQLDIEEKKLEELKKLRKCVEANNKIQQEKVDLMKKIYSPQSNLILKS